MKRIKRELLTLLPALLFFFLAFNLLSMTEALMTRNRSLAFSNQSYILLGSFIVAKVLVIVDNMPFLSGFSRLALIYNVLWKSFVYGTTALGIRFVTNGLHYLFHSENLRADYELFLEGIDWTRFWAIQLWFYALFFVFALIRDLTRAIGKEKILKILFHKNGHIG